MARLPSASQPLRRIVLVAGPSGSGKSEMARRSGLPVVGLDEFYRDAGDDSLPHRFGIVDWDDPSSWHGDAAVEALARLARDGVAEVPEYSIRESRRTGMRTMDVRNAPLIVAEGIFAAELVAPLREAGLLADALVMDRATPLVFSMRLARDITQARKPPLTLLRRGYGLARDQRGDLSHWEQAGMRPVTMRTGTARLRELADLATAESHARTGERAQRGPTVLRIAAVCFLRIGRGGLEIFAVRKRGTDAYMQVGGKLEPGESPVEAACREVLEELDVALDPEDLEPLGDFEAVAANEEDHVVAASVFLAASDTLPRDVRVQAELDDAVWAPLTDLPSDKRFAPLMTDFIVPTLREQMGL